MCSSDLKATAFFKTAKRTVELSESNDGYTFGKVVVCAFKQLRVIAVCINAVYNG